MPEPIRFEIFSAQDSPGGKDFPDEKQLAKLAKEALAARSDLVQGDCAGKDFLGWLDLPLPALCGMTPREAVRTKEGKDRVDVLLKDLENHECRLPEEERFSFSGMRRELGLDG